MKEQCFDEGTIQSFLDGELAPGLLENVACHVALCDNCALLLTEAEDESAFAFNILDEEFNSLVPTERIRMSIFQAISEIKEPKISWWQKLFGGFSFTNPSIAAFASLIFAVGIFAVVLRFNSSQESLQIATNSTQPIEKTINVRLPKIVEPMIEKSIIKPVEIERINYNPEPKVKVQKSKVEVQKPKITPLVTVEKINGEETYLKTIATLENTVKDKKDNVLKASSRVSFERDMAVVDDSIKRMKDEVRKNPKNEAAKQILRNSYQNKIELLNSVSERSEFMARLDK